MNRQYDDEENLIYTYVIKGNDRLDFLEFDGDFGLDAILYFLYAIAYFFIVYFGLMKLNDDSFDSEIFNPS